MAERAVPRRAVLLVALLVLASVVGVGLLVGDSGDERVQRPSADEASTQLRALDGFTATRYTVIERGNETSRKVDRISRRLGRGVRIERRSGPGSVDLVVANESVRWQYDRDTNTVTRYDMSGDERAGFARIPRLLRRVNGSTTRATPTGTPSVSPLPVVPSASGSPSVAGPVGAGQGAYSVTFRGRDTVAGRTVFVVAVTGPESTAGPVANYTQTLWLDTEHYVPVKRQTAWTQGGERTVVTTTYRNVTFDPAFAAGTFTFEPPANATVERPTGPREFRYDSVATLRSAASLSVPDPDLAEGYVLASATRTDGRRITSIGLRYVNATATIEVAKLRPVYQPRSEGRRVTIAGQSGTYRNLGPERSVVWTCNGSQYKVSTSGLGRAATVDIARSVGCR